MNKLTEEITSLLRPQAALIAYHCPESHNDYYLEMREIENGKMGAGRPVSCEFMNNISSNYSQSYTGTPFGSIPKTMLYTDTRKGQEKYIWFNAPGKRMMYFDKELHIENAEYNVPGVIYVVKNNALSMYAFKNRRPADDTALFLAPFFNTSSTDVCLGTARLQIPKNLTYADLITHWEKRFWQSEFSHLSNEGNPTVHNLVLVTKAARTQPFDLNELKPIANKTLKQLYK
mgnify:FL=1